jgi:hypothetical protein
MSRGIVRVGVAGPDGAGKTTLTGLIADEARRRGVRVVTIHPYGCVFCRRWPTGHSETSGGANGGTRRGRVGLLRRGHAYVDLAELMAQLWGAALLARLRLPGSRRGPGLVVTDRTPLDTLVKHRPRAGSPLLRHLHSLAGGYDRIVVLVADSAVLAERDPYYTLSDMAAMRDRFSAVAVSAPEVLVADTTGGMPEELVESMLDGLVRRR